MAGAICLAVIAILLSALRLRREAPQSAAAFDLQVYRDQLSGLQRDVASGVVTAVEADQLRAEISRRILEADRKLQSATALPQAPFPIAVIAAGIATTLALTFLLYARIGAPGYADLPLAQRIAASDTYRANRPAQAEVEASVAPAPARQPDAEFADLMVKLRQAVKDRPDDTVGLDLLARNEAALGNLGAARDAQTALIAAKKGAATSSDHAVLAEFLISLAGGYVSPEAEASLIRALELDPENGLALYYSGLMFAQSDRADMGFRVWQGLLETSPADAPWLVPVRAGIEEMAARAGIRFTLPEAPGPSAADVKAAGEMDPEDRKAMIKAMVQGLSDRLASEGGPAADWARLITSLAVLGDLDRARAIHTEARGRFAGRAEDLAVLDAAAKTAGLSQ